MGVDKLTLNLQIGIVTFFLSSVLDNLTSTIVMVSLLRKLVPPSEYRKYVSVMLLTSNVMFNPFDEVLNMTIFKVSSIRLLKLDSSAPSWIK